MAIEYSWKVTGIKTSTVGTADNVVVQTYWEKTGKDGEHEGTFKGATPFSANSMPEGTKFISFDKLTEEDVLSWIKADILTHNDYEKHINERIQEEIDKLKNPVVEATLPWAPVDTGNVATSNT